MKKPSIWLTLILSLILFTGIYSAFHLRNSQNIKNDERLKTATAEQLNNISQDILSAITKFNYGLRGLRAAIDTTGFENFNYQKQLGYFKSRDYQSEFPGARGFGLIKYVENHQLEQFLQNATQDRQGKFELKLLDEPKDPLFIIQYIEPETNNLGAIGLDIGSEHNRRVAALKAASLNKPQLTGPITLVQADQSTKHGFLLLLPIYKQDTRDAANDIAGWVYAPLLITEILDTVSANNAQFQFEIDDVSNANYVHFYSSTNAQKTATKHKVNNSFLVFGRTWQISISPTEVFIQALNLQDANRTFVNMLGITFFITLLFYLLAAVASSRLRKMKDQAAFANVVNNASDGIIGVDNNFAILQWNEAANLLFDFEEKDACGKPLANWLTAGISAEKLINYFKQVARGESVRNINFVCQSTTNQRDKKLIFNISPIYQNKKFWGATININDVTEIDELHKKLEKTNLNLNNKVNEATAQLSKELNFQQSIIDSDNSAIIAFDNSGIISLFNNSAIDLLGYNAQEVIEKTNILQLIEQSSLPESLSLQVIDKVTFADAMKDALSKELIPPIILLRSKAGQSIKVKLSITGLINSNGFVLIANDLSEKQDLENNIAMVNAAVDNAKEILLWLKKDGSIQRANPYAAERLNYSSIAFKHLNINDLVDFKTAGTWENILNEILEKQQHSFEINFRTASGEWLQTLVSGCVINIENSQLIFLSGKNIAQRVAEETQLKNALSKADAANKAKTEFIANMSHELRTPLNAANGFLQLLELTRLDEIQQRHIAKTKTAISSLTHTVDEILEVTYAEQNQLRLDQSDFVLDELLAEVGLFLYEMTGDKPLEIHFKVAPNVPYIMHGDKNKLKRILLNLGNNAVKFSKQGEVTIELSAAKQGKGHIRLQVNVKDNGIGIDKTKLNTIFDMFSQANNAANRQFGGLGIGLTIANQYVNFLGGNIEVSSELNVGSDFKFTILVQPAVHAQSSKLAFLSESAINVLLVDDNKTSLSILGGTITQLGWQLTSANNAKDAITLFKSAIAQNTPFDLALIDWKMPEIDGWELSESIRKIAPVAQMPLLIMVTAHSKEMFALNHSKNSKLLNGFLTKPVTRAQLINAFYDAVASSKQTSQTTPPSLNNKALLKMRILIVEDNPTNQTIVKALLESQGASTTVSCNGFDAIVELENSLLPFDVILMDIQMPGIDGYETTKRIRAMSKFAQLPIIAMTANVMPSDKEQCFAVGMNGHIGKPFELNNVVKQILLITNKFENVQLNTEPKLATLQSESDLIADFCAKENINLQDAMQRFNHLDALYLKSLKLFLSDLETYEKQLQDPNASFNDLNLIFHTLKSTAGALGFATLTEQAALNDLKLHNEGIENFDIVDYSDFSFICNAALNTVSQLIALLAENDLPISGTEQGEPDFMSSYAQLKIEVDSFNMHAINTFQLISVSLKSLSSELADELISALNKLKFKAAKEILERFDKKIDNE